MQNIYFTLFYVKLKSAEDIFQNNLSAEEKEEAINLLVSFQTRCLQSVSTSFNTTEVPSTQSCQLFPSVDAKSTLDRISTIYRAIQEDITHEASLVSEEMCKFDRSGMNSPSTNRFVAEAINMKTCNKIIDQAVQDSTEDITAKPITTDSYNTSIKRHGSDVSNVVVLEEPYFDHSEVYDIHDIGEDIIAEEMTQTPSKTWPERPSALQEEMIIDVFPSLSNNYEKGKCGSSNGKKKLLKKFKIKSDKTVAYNFKCSECDIGFYFGSHYDKHMETHENWPWDCAICDRKCQSFIELSDHYQIVHSMNVSIDNAVKRKYTCNKCDKSFDKPSSLFTHQKREGPIKCEPCQRVFKTRNRLLMHEQSYSHCKKSGQKFTLERNFLCTECGKSFYKWKYLKIHMICHNTEKLYTCKHCSYKSPHSGAVKSHMKRHFESERTHLCELCGACFHANNNLQIHMTFKHNDVRNFSCSSCSSKFKSRQEQIRHTKRHHSENKIEKCFCGKEYRHRASLRKHMKSVHGSDGNLPPIMRVKTLDQPSKSIYKEDPSKPKPAKEKKKKNPKPLSGFRKFIMVTSRGKGAMKSKLKTVISTSKRLNEESTNILVNSKNIAEDKVTSLLSEKDDQDINKITKEKYKEILHKKNGQKKNMKINQASSTVTDCQSKLMESSQIPSEQDNHYSSEENQIIEKPTVVNQTLVEQKGKSYIQTEHSYCVEKQPVFDQLNGKSQQTSYVNSQQTFYINTQQNNYINSQQTANYINLQQNSYVNLQPTGYIHSQPLFIPLFNIYGYGSVGPLALNQGVILPQ
ncbi:zinc finger protein 287-like [Mytilus californianus]|uniref:zinc finger protein 287-like n=1 Tax=Mytilus californianus TaxID=6549 RepID=UPI00224826E9|nr:zinc finger protein 287-like [Mytilus californianus]